MGVGAKLKGLFATLSTTNLYVAGILALAGAFVYLSAVVNNAENSINALYENFEKSLNVLKDNQNELQSLADEYKFISSKETLSYEDKTRLLDIQTILNTKYSDSIAPMNLYIIL